MRAVIQRVTKSSVSVNNKIVGQIGFGLNIFLGVEDTDTIDDVKYMAEKIPHLRIFEDKDGKFNLSLFDVEGEILAISQFTLMGDARKGRRPGFTKAASPDIAKELYEKFIDELKKQGIKVEKGIFQKHMSVSIENDGPVTILLDSSKLF